MKNLTTFTIILLLSLTAKGQYLITNFTGTAIYGTRSVTVTSAGSVLTYADPCLGPPTLYWAGQIGPGSYSYSFNRPVYSINVDCDYLNSGTYGAGEYLSMNVNGSFYALTAANMTSYSVCGSGGGPSYLYTGFLMGPNTAGFAYNGGSFTISMCTGISSFEIYCNGIEAGVTWHVGFDTLFPCIHAIANSPCVGDTLKLDMVGDSTGATYLWTGPGGFTSVLQAPFIFPCVMTDSGLYTCIRTLGLVSDTDSVRVVIHPKPVLIVSNNSPLCMGLVDTLNLSVVPDSAGETFFWTGPGGFTSGLEYPTLTNFTNPDTGQYMVIGTTRFGCKDTGYTYVTVIQQPPPPIITDMNYCQGTPFVPFSVVHTGSLLWWPSATGGVSTSIAPVVNTSVPGLYKVWASQMSGGCQSLRGTDSVRVTTMPAVPVVTGPDQYCQFIGPFVPFNVATTVTGMPQWYTTATGGTGVNTQPFVNIAVPGVYNFWVSQVDSGCESGRRPVTITVHPKPNPPAPDAYTYCQHFQPQMALTATPSGSGDYLTWFGPGDSTIALSGAPTPQDDTVKTDTFWVDETTIYSCVSDKVPDLVHIIAKPPAPLTTDTAYCQFSQAAPLNTFVDSIFNGTLNWYLSGVALPPIPVPSSANPGITTWYVSQTVNGCQSDSTPVSVTIIPLPVFNIQASSPWVCQYDSLKLSYSGPSYPNPAYLWTLPAGDPLTTGSSLKNPSIMVVFDSSSDSTYLVLTTTDDNGKCSTQQSVRVTVIPHPTAYSYSKQDVCMGDTVTLAISTQSPDAYKFNWYVDYTTPIANSTAMAIIASNSNSGGPFSITWLDTGTHVIQLNTFTEQGCTSKPTFDTVNVHAVPDASFKITNIGNSLCIEDSVLFSANTINYNLAYAWAPAHSFTNINEPSAWGRVELAQSIITLKVTDPFGCAASASLELDPGTCCTVAFPNAFTPNGDGQNDFFRPLFSGYHRFHEFRILNRWGQTVFESANSSLQWDGNYNGVPQDIGVYFYYIKYDCGGKTIEESGDVTLIR